MRLTACATWPLLSVDFTFRHFTYVTAHSPTLPSLYLRHSSFSNPFFASPTSQDFQLRHLARFPWSRSNIITSHAVGQGLIPARVSYLIEIFFWIFPQPYDKRQEIWATFVPGYHIAIIYHPNHISSVYGRRRLSP